jgi:GlpG protein
VRRAPPWGEFARFPAVSTTIALAAIASFLAWSGRDLSILREDAHIARGELWRFVTSALLHVNVFHLLFNVYWVWSFGTLVESVFGTWRTVATFVLLAAVSGAAEYAIHGGGVGLSGVGYGLFGMICVLSRRDSRFAGAVDTGTVTLFVAWFFLCIFLTAQGQMHVGNVAHGAGGALGAALGATVSLRGGRRVLVATGTTVLVVASVLGATIWRPLVNRSPYRGDDEARLGHAALRDGRNEEAVRWLVDSTRLDPQEAGTWFNLGIAYQRLSRFREAAGAYERAHRLRPDDSDFRGMYEAMRRWTDRSETEPENP